MAGRGRGRASTLPAWMTKQQNNDGAAPPPAVAIREDARPGQFDDAPEPRSYAPNGDAYRQQNSRSPPPRRMEDFRGPPPNAHPVDTRAQPFYGDISGNNHHTMGGNGGGGPRGPPRHINNGRVRSRSRSRDRRPEWDRSRQRSRSRSRDRRPGPPGPPPQQPWDAYGRRGMERGGRSRSRSRERDAYRRLSPNFNRNDDYGGGGGRRGEPEPRGYGYRDRGYDDRRDDRRGDRRGFDEAYRREDPLDHQLQEVVEPERKSGTSFLSGKRFGDLVREAAKSAAEEFTSSDGHDDRTHRDYSGRRR